jgi:hypothetical protein
MKELTPMGFCRIWSRELALCVQWAELAMSWLGTRDMDGPPPLLDDDWRDWRHLRAAVVEIMSTAFQSGEFGSLLSGIDKETGKPRPMRLGHYFLAINIEAICDLETFKTNAGNFLRFVRGSKKDPQGPGRIWTGTVLCCALSSPRLLASSLFGVAGEPEWDARQRRTAAGGVMVPPALLKDMKDLREYLPGIREKYPQFPFETE